MLGGLLLPLLSGVAAVFGAACLFSLFSSHSD
jgi:hypothetical protein